MKQIVRLIAAIFLTGWIGAAYAQTAANRASLETQNNTFVYTNGQGAITAATLNPLLGNYAASMATLLDANVFISTQTYLAAPIFAGLTGYCYANSRLPITCSTSINGASITGTNTLALSLLQQIPQRTVLGNQFGAQGNVSTAWTVPNSTDTIIPLVHGAVAAGDYACFADSLGTLDECGSPSTNFAATFPLSVTFPSGVATYALNYNSTLTVDGSNDLGINLANANTWSAAQTFPNSSITNVELANDSTTVNGVPCTLGSTCTITATAANALTFGTHLTGTSYNGSAAVTIGTDATSANTAGTLMARDGSGNVSVNTLIGSVTGHSSLDLAIANNLSDLQSATTARANLDLTPGTGLAISGANLNLQPAQAASIGGVESITSATHQWVAYIDTSGIPHQSQPSASDLSNGVTGSGAVVLANSSTLNGTTSFVGTNGLASPTISATEGIGSTYNVSGYNFGTNADFGSFGDLNTTFGLVVMGGKNSDTATHTGSWQTFSARYTGFGGGTSSSFLTAGQELMAPRASVNNIFGHYVGNNPQCIIPTGFTAAECTGEEIDVDTLSNIATERNGLRIADIGSTGSHATGDTGLSILTSNSGIGFTHGIYFGEAATATTGFPVPAGGDVLNTATSSAVLASGINLSNLSGAFPGIVFSNGNASLLFGGLTYPGGRIRSGTTSGGPDVIFAANEIAINNNGDNTGIAILSTTQTEIQPTTASTSTTTGALRVDGGMGVAGAAWVGGTANIAGVMTLQAQPVLASSTTGAGTQTFTNSPCAGLTSEKWIPVSITGQTGTWYVPACQ